MATGGESLTLQDAADRLGVHYMTAYRYVRLGRLPATRDGEQWRVRLRDIQKMEHAPRRRGERGFDATALARAGLVARMIAGDGAGAWGVVERRLAMGADPPSVLTDVVVPALHSIGDQWATGEVSVAEEHRATAVAFRVIGRIGLQFGRRGKRRGKVLLAAPAGDLHSLPVAIAADLLRWRGFETVELGANNPAAAMADLAQRSGPLTAIGIVSTTDGFDAEISAAVATLRREVPDVPILIGGGAIRDKSHADQIGGDVFTGGDASGAVDAVERIAGSRNRRLRSVG